MSIKYRSTRGGQSGLSFEEVVLGGLATDKGLFVPESIPSISKEELDAMRKMTFPDLAFVIVSKFISSDQIPSQDLKYIVRKSFSSFRHEDVTPTLKLSKFWVLELFHGPTFAFKDVALQFLGNLFEYFLTRGKYQNSITILGATSGDTGSAAIHGLRGKKNVHCFIMYPDGKVTDIQERQMTTIPDENVHCINIKGNFDDAQALVKAAFADESFRNEVKLGAINSINWARVLAQITYYFYSYLRTTEDIAKGDDIKMMFAVPTGNFGDILAGYYAKRMGLLVDKLVVCTNENDVLHRFFETGTYKKQPATLSIAPSMDISVSSNFERYLFYLSGENSAQLNAWMNEFESTGAVSLPKACHDQAKIDFSSASSTKSDIIAAMREIYESDSYLLCPHTATAAVAVKKLNLPAERIICLATAHPAKFEEAVNLALKGQRIPARPTELQKLFVLPTRSKSLPNQLTKIEGFVREKIQPKPKKFSLIPAILFVSVIVVGVLVYTRSRK